MSKFKIGDIVKLITERHGIAVVNPVYNKYKITGTVVSTTEGSLPIGVKWDNSFYNVYLEGDLDLAEKKVKKITGYQKFIREYIKI